MTLLRVVLKSAVLATDRRFRRILETRGVSAPELPTNTSTIDGIALSFPPAP